jgi:hypothetical protein
MQLPNEIKSQYRFAGLSVESNTRFSIPTQPWLVDRAPDVKFNLKPARAGALECFHQRLPVTFIKNGGGHPSIAVYQFEKLFLLECDTPRAKVKFVMPRDGQWIDCYTGEETTEEEIQVWLFGLVMAFLLQARGIFTLHAAAISYRGQAIAFLGPNGYGKSTLAYFFVRNGHALITDDVLPLVNNHGRLFAAPGCPSMNLWEQTLYQLRAMDSNLSSNQRKHRYSVDTLEIDFCKSPVPLQRIYLLHPKTGPGKPEIVELSKSNALIELFAFTRASSTIDIADQQVLLKTYSSLLLKVPVRKLLYPWGFKHLPDIYQSVLQDSHDKHSTAAATDSTRGDDDQESRSRQKSYRADH